MPPEGAKKPVDVKELIRSYIFSGFLSECPITTANVEFPHDTLAWSHSLDNLSHGPEKNFRPCKKVMVVVWKFGHYFRENPEPG